MIKQISVFMENRVGILSKFARVIENADMELLAMCIADTTDFGILRCIVTDPTKCVELLRENGFTASPTNVLILRLPQQGISAAFDTLADCGITVEYMYSLDSRRDEGVAVVFKVDKTEEAVRALREKGITLLSEQEIYSRND